MKLTIEIKFFDEQGEYYKEVEFSGKPYWTNDGIGSYEFWGMRGYDAGQDYVDVEDITWDREKMTISENYQLDRMDFEDVVKVFVEEYKELTKE